ncbi:triose-phosphate isomerase family protein [Microbacterium sp. NPDC064584]|uniref:triose-phosphate isomerase family protein n=1 Tax=Microbacterium sp. NPDC064584 TaxID=3155817 RepID=UPI003432367A
MGEAQHPAPEPRSVPTLLGVSLKLYLDIGASEAWARGVAAIAGRHPAVVDGSVQVFVLPSLPALPAVRQALAGTKVAVGAQDLHWEDRGPFTGAISGVDLRDAGCTFVEVGHAERRTLFGETDDIVARKLAAAMRNSLTPVLCIGEENEGPAEDAVLTSTAQLASALDGLDDAVRGDLVVAYEPVWAIGRPKPANAAHVSRVVAALREMLDRNPRIARSWVIYGGSAQAGSLNELGRGVDGLFMGRFAHNPIDLARMVDEAALLTT